MGKGVWFLWFISLSLEQKWDGLDLTQLKLLWRPSHSYECAGVCGGEQGEGRKGWLPGGRTRRRQACAVRPRRAAAVQKGPKPKGPLGADPHSTTNELEIRWEAQSSVGVTAQENWRLWENKFPEQCSSPVTSFSGLATLLMKGNLSWSPCP